MPEFTGSKTTGLLDSAVQTLSDVSYNGARVRCVQDRTPAVAAWAENDTILLARLPGDVVLNIDSIIKFGAFGASVTCDIGVRPVTGAAFATDPDAIVADIDVSSAATSSFVAAADADKKLWEFTDLSAEPAIMPEIEVYASLLDANPTDDAVMAWSIHYMLD